MTRVGRFILAIGKYDYIFQIHYTFIYYTNKKRNYMTNIIDFWLVYNKNLIIFN